jgi:hypothetical protein
VADRDGLTALMPKGRRKPQMPEATPTHVIEALLTLAVAEPTIGCRQYADRLGDRGFSIAKSTVQRHLVAHGLGKRAQRLARAAAITATTGLVTEAARKNEPFGFCLASGGPGELVCLDSFYIGKLKGVGTVYQPTAIDVFTRWAVVAIVLSPVSGAHTMRFIDQVLRAHRRHGEQVRAILTDIHSTGTNTWSRASDPIWWPRARATSGSQRGLPTTTQSASASIRPSSKSAGARPSTGVTSAPSPNSRPKPMPG